MREALERIIRAETGALIVLGDEEAVQDVVSGGIRLDAEFTPERLSELSKMDGAVVLSSDLSRIAYANVHLIPDPSIPTSESGMRHRTAERVAKQTGVPVVAVSQQMRRVTVYTAEQRHVLEDLGALLARANQVLQALERYRARLDSGYASLSALEVEDAVLLRDVVTVLQRSEMVLRMGAEGRRYVLELGSEGRLLRLQLEELLAGVEGERILLIKDYAVEGKRADPAAVADELKALSSQELVDLCAVASVLGFPASPESLETPVTPRGYRLLSRIPKLPQAVVENLVEHFGSLPAMMSASIESLDAVEGVGEARARAIREGLLRVAEASLLDRIR